MLKVRNGEQMGERAVSPVIGVVLMVAITVILAATIGTFVMNGFTNVSAPVNAGVSADFSDSDDSVTVQIQSVQEQDTEVTVSFYLNGSNTAEESITLSSVGEKYTASGTNYTDGTSVQVIAVAQNGERQTTVLDQTNTI